MFHKASSLRFLEGTALELSFQDGYIKQYDMARLFQKYPQLKALQDRQLFTSGKLQGAYGIMWNDELDIEAETIYEEGTTVRKLEPSPSLAVAQAVLNARARAGMSQAEVASASGIDQSDISKIERGLSNPSVSTLGRIAAAMGCSLNISIV